MCQAMLLVTKQVEFFLTFWLECSLCYFSGFAWHGLRFLKAFNPALW